MRMFCLGRFSRKLLSSRRVAGLALGALIGLGGLQSSANAATYTPADGTALQALLDSSSVVLGDTIVLNANATYTVVGNSLRLRAKSGTGYLTIQSSNLASLPGAGVRAKPSDAANMPKIVSWGSNVPAIETAYPPEVAHHYKFIGIEVYNGGTQTTLQDLIILGVNGPAQNSDSVIPHNIIFDRCYIHGQGMTPGTKQLNRAIGLHSKSTDIINCTISDVLNNHGQTQCIGGWNGPGPYLIDNNFFSCSGESVLFGGADGYVVGQNPTGIVISRNHFYKDPAWKNVWTRPCNHFELKCGKNVIVRDNLLENCWNGPDNQMGVSINLKCVQGPSGGAGSSWFLTEDVTIENNLIRNVGIGIQLAGSVNPSGTELAGQPKNVTIRNNLIYNVTDETVGGYANRGWLFYMGNGSPNVTIDHNTGFSTHMWMNPGYTNLPHSNFVFTNNLVMKGVYGILAGGMSDGEVSIAAYYPGIVFQKNVVVGGSLPSFDPNYLNGWNLAPFSNSSLLTPGLWTNVLANYSAPGSDFSGWKVAGWDQSTNYVSYPYNNTGTDGKDLGCDIDQLNTKIAGCVSGVWSGSPPSGGTTVTLKNGVNGYNGATSFHVDGQLPTSYQGSSRYYHASNSLPGTHGYMLRPFYKFDVSPAASGIPAGATITSAKFKVKVEFKDPATDAGASAYRVAPTTGFTVNYAAATRNTYNGTNAWTGGANAAGEVADSNNDYIDTPAGTVASIPAAGGWMEFPVTSAVQAWVNGTANNGLLILNNVHPQGSTVTTRLSTPADLNGSAEYPELEVTYQTPAQSTLIASDGFNYTVPGGLVGKNGGTGFGSNAWVIAATDPALASGSLAYSDGTNSIITSGNKVQPVGNSRATRNFANPITTASSTKWLSFRIKRAPGTFPSNHAGFSLFSGTGGGGNEIFFGKPASGTNWGIFHSGTNQTAIATGTVQYDAFVVCKMVFTSSTVTIQMWVNPILIEGSLGTAQAQLTNLAHTTSVASLRLSTGTNSTGYEFDEFRMGGSFADVTD